MDDISSSNKYCKFFQSQLLSLMFLTLQSINMSIKTFSSKWIKNRELVFLGIAVAFIVHFSGLPKMFATFSNSIPLGLLLVGFGLFALVCVTLKKPEKN